MPIGDQRTEVAIEEGEQECTDMRSIHISIGHDDDTVISELFDVECLSDRSSESNDEVFDFLIGKNLIYAGLFGIQDFSAKREDRLIFAITTLLGTSSRRVSLDDVELAFSWVFA